MTVPRLTAEHATTPAHRTRLPVHGAVFELGADRQAVLDHVSAYVVPAEPGPLTTGYTITQVTTAQVDRLVRDVRTGHRRTGHAEVFMGTRYERYQVPGSGTVGWIGPADQRLLLFANGRHITLWVHPDGSAVEREMLRVVREIVYRSLLGCPGVSFHAGGLAAGDRGVLLVGPSGAGKTTLLVALLAAGAGAFVTNDRAVLAGTGPTIYGTPLPIRVGVGSVLGMPLLNTHLAAGRALERPQEVDWPAAATGRLLDDMWGSDRKIELSTRELLHFTGAMAAASAPLSTIVVPRIVRSAAPVTVRELDPAATERILHGECTTPVDRRWPEPWLVTPEHHADVPGWIHRVATGTPAWLLTFGTDWAHRLDELAAALGTVLDRARPGHRADSGRNPG